MIKYQYCAVNCNLREYCPSMPLPVPPNYNGNLGKRAHMGAKGVLPPTFKMILETYYPLLIPHHQPPQTPPQYDVPRRRSSAQFAQSPPQQQPCSVSRVTTDIRTKEPEQDNTGKRRGEPPDVRVCREGEIEGNIKSERIVLESLAGTGLEASRQQRLSSRVIQRATAGSCSLADGSSNFGKPFLFKPLLG